jgi:pimeloyl-ACP methyl ester carboxylesterase
MAVVRREPSLFWRRARRAQRHAIQPVGPALPLGTVVRVPGRGEVFVRYAPGPPGAPTVLLLHGWMASADLNWLGTFAELDGRYHVLAMDVRGHGRGIRSSEPFSLEDCADDAAGLLRELNVHEAVVVGYSMGGLIALLLARRHPARVRGLVLAATAAELARTGLGRGLGAAIHLLGALVRSGLPDRVLREVVRSRPAALGDFTDLAPWMAGEAKRLHPADIVGAGQAIAGFDARPWLGQLDVPAASVVTCRDRAVAPGRQRATAAALGGTVVEVDGGHAVCATDPEVLGVAIRRAVDLVVAARGAPGGRRDWWLVRAADRWRRADATIAPVSPPPPSTVVVADEPSPVGVADDGSSRRDDTLEAAV